MTTPETEPPVTTPAEPNSARTIVPFVIGGGAIVVAIGVAALVFRAESKISKTALADAPKPVSVVIAKATTFRATRRYVGTLEPWVSASIGPQLVSAYVDTVLVRPGAAVRRGDVLATLDCRSASAASQAVASQARAIDEKQRAQASEAARYRGLLDGGFVSPNELEMRQSAAAAQGAELSAERAKLVGTALEVNDCVLRAPFDGEIATRTVDPGAFVRPGVPIVSVVDRHLVRYAADVPEVDFPFVQPGIPIRIRLVSVGRDLEGTIARTAPAADPATRTVRFEVDLPDDRHEIPVGTTGEASLEVGAPIAVTEVPLTAAAIRGGQATLFVIEDGVARQRVVAVVGERNGSLFTAPTLTSGAAVVVEGRGLLADGDHVKAKEVAP